VEKGYQVWGIDLDEKKIKAIKQGKSPIKDDYIQERRTLLKKLQVSKNFSAIKRLDIVIVCVPTPVDSRFFPVLTPLKSAVKEIAKKNNPGQLIIIESTINPGVCEEVLLPVFEKYHLKEGRDFFLAHCPERIDPGNPKWNVGNIPRVVGAVSRQGGKLAKEFYQTIIDAEIKLMQSIQAAEAVKMVENSFRDINIAFVNELAQSFDRMGIDVKEVIDGAATKPFAFMPHYPSCGVGGHCIPVDPYYLIEQAKKNGFDHRFLQTARSVNNFMPEYTVELMQDLLNEVGLPFKKTAVGVLGLSYKADVADLRESPALKIIKLLKKKKARVICYDPYLPNLSNVKTIQQFLSRAQAFILATNHNAFLEIDENLFEKYDVKAIVDGKNCLNHSKIKRLGIKYHGIGRH
jgi:nucleotide sugar dehydrogenase